MSSRIAIDQLIRLASEKREINYKRSPELIWKSRNSSQNIAGAIIQNRSAGILPAI